MAETPTPQIDPFRFMALVAQCAIDSHIEIEHAFRFVQQFVPVFTAALLQQQGKASPAPPAAPPRPSSTVQ